MCEPCTHQAKFFISKTEYFKNGHTLYLNSQCFFSCFFFLPRILQERAHSVPELSVFFSINFFHVFFHFFLHVFFSIFFFSYFFHVFPSPEYFKNGHTLYLNSGLSSSRNHYGQRVITREADLVTAHEFGHNWGSEHDPDRWAGHR